MDTEMFANPVAPILAVAYGLVAGSASALTEHPTQTSCDIAHVQGAQDCTGVWDGNDSQQMPFSAFGHDDWTEVLKWDPEIHGVNGTDGTSAETGAFRFTITTEDRESGQWAVNNWAGFENVMFVLKGSDSFSAFLMDLDTLSGYWTNESMLNNDGRHPEISHWTVYTTGQISEVPLPAAGFLLAGGIGALAFRGRRRRD